MIIFKVIEKVLHDQANIYIYIYIYIFGTITNLDFKKSVFVTFMLPIDLQKTFVAISHQVLLKRVKAIKFHKTVFSCLGPTFETEYFWQKLKTNSLIFLNSFTK